MHETDLNNTDAAAQYAHSIERERAARLEMESHPPGSIQRALAWKEWSEAIVRTNRAWRCLRDSNAGASRREPASARPERPHAGA